MPKYTTVTGILKEFDSDNMTLSLWDKEENNEIHYDLLPEIKVQGWEKKIASLLNQEVTLKLNDGKVFDVVYS